MTAQALIAEARSLGIALFADGDRIKARPAGRMSAELRARIAAEKPAVLELLRAPVGPFVADPRRCDDCGRGPFTLLSVTRAGMRICRHCWAATTRVPSCQLPATPGLDATIARIDGERERA